MVVHSTRKPYIFSLFITDNFIDSEKRLLMDNIDNINLEDREYLICLYYKIELQTMINKLACVHSSAQEV